MIVFTDLKSVSKVVNYSDDTYVTRILEACVRLLFCEFMVYWSMIS